MQVKKKSLKKFIFLVFAYTQKYFVLRKNQYCIIARNTKEHLTFKSEYVIDGIVAKIIQSFTHV